MVIRPLKTIHYLFHIHHLMNECKILIFAYINDRKVYMAIRPLKITIL